MQLAYIPGVWDLLHVGHLAILETAKNLSDRLCIGVADDDVVLKDKGKPPIIPLEHRVRMLSSISCVDLVIPYDKLDFIPQLEMLQPNILIVGEDWGNALRHIEAEEWMRNKGGKIIKIPYNKEESSTRIKERISVLEQGVGMLTVSDVIKDISSVESVQPLAIPAYYGESNKGIALAVESMRRHTADAGWQIMAGLERSGYTLCGYKLPINTTDTVDILSKTDPGVVVVQDKREWDIPRGNFREPLAKFDNVQTLATRSDLFKLTILKDAHQRPSYHRQSAEEMGVHAWIIYYHPRIVKHVAPYIRPEHCIRVYHTVNANAIPEFKRNREGCLLSGAVSGAYPLRKMISNHYKSLPQVTYKEHPGYHANGCVTPQYLKELTNYKVSICTSSRYGYTLRKIVEATACGCVVLTNLPVDEQMPEIDSNLIRVSKNPSLREVQNLLLRALDTYDYDRQEHLAKKARHWYHFRNAGQRLTEDIEKMRVMYNQKLV